MTFSRQFVCFAWQNSLNGEKCKIVPLIVSALEDVKKINKKQFADEVLYSPPNQVISHEAI